MLLLKKIWEIIDFPKPIKSEGSSKKNPATPVMNIKAKDAGNILLMRRS